MEPGLSSINSHCACSVFKRIKVKNVFVLSTSAFLFSKLGIVVIGVGNKRLLVFSDFEAPSESISGSRWVKE